MRVAVVNAMAPFLWGGAEELALHLTHNLRRAGHDARLIGIPFNWEPYSDIPTEMARLKALRIDGYDRVISLKFPIYLIGAENHVTWLIHQYRQAYDLWETPYTNLPHSIEGDQVRDLIVATDNAVLGSRHKLFTISDEVSDRLRRFNNIEAPALKLPLNDPDVFIGGAYGDYILAPGRVNSMKRQWLLVEAMRHMDRDARLIIAGPPEVPADAEQLRRLVQDYGLADRVKLDLRFMDRAEVVDYVNNCRAVAYLPYMEDAYGYVTMEANEAGKAVITAQDSGAVCQLVQDGSTGLTVEPEPEALAQAMSSYLKDERLAREHGDAARQYWHSLGINWGEIISRLLES